ncbi:helix-turn-helix domain-containing protein [Tahibacter harae]|uniref:Helix-turn-helix domain-containing protein n=1 Tax=Tahibacter harae TaxID=2963937 RepID=A0ABT1QYU5_9GAMM|nr:helix-turn-helix transcriptional regulator [Tahibacter harae]MCQ4167459.1 helix-turn-helix domain-containing protein [Tahibacter harae]
MDTFGSRMKALRSERGLTQEDLAHEVGVTKGAISQWERDGTEPNFAALAVIARTLGVSLDGLILGPAATFTAEASLTTKEAELLALFRSLSAKKRTALLVLLDL